MFNSSECIMEYQEERHEIDKFKSWNFTPPSFEELHGNDVYHSRYVAT